MKKRLFITWVTHNSRYNEKMKLLKIKKQEGYFLDFDNRLVLYKLIEESLNKNSVEYYALNILSDHVHVVIKYEESKLADLIGKIKGGVSFQYTRLKKFQEIGEGRQNKIWARGYSVTYIDTQEHFDKAIQYTLNNHIKHGIEDIYPYFNRGL